MKAYPRWTIKKIANFTFKNPVLIEGLPGTGNVGKITTEFIAEGLDAKKIYEITSQHFPNCVFINDKNIVELPKIEIYAKKIRNKDLMIVTGDIQPVDEVATYELCEILVELLHKNKGKEIITLGGIGLDNVPNKPKVYISGTDAKVLKKYAEKGIKTNPHSVVGPIVGVSGLLIALGKQKKKMSGVVLLVETLNHPAYVGLQESRELIKFLNSKFKFNLNIKTLDKEIKLIEKEVKEKIEKVLNIQEEKTKKKTKEAVTYIG